MSRALSLTCSSWRDVISAWKGHTSLSSSRTFSNTSTLHRGGSPKGNKPPPPRSSGRPKRDERTLFIPPPPPALNRLAVPLAHGDSAKKLSVAEVPAAMAANIDQWAKDTHTLRRLESFGLKKQEAKTILNAFTDRMKQGTVFTDLEYSETELSRIAFDLSRFQYDAMLNRYRTRVLYEWAVHPTGRSLIQGVIPSLTLDRMDGLFKAVDFSKPHAFWPLARSQPRRKIIMHVGPTNSGKTHTALRALASAKRGLYAGPLRLLAHEIWERLNMGKIVPLEVEDPKESLRVSKSGDPRYARVCNMLTGEEQKIVDNNAQLLSCTIEMVPWVQHFDVAVIDEIQMITNSERGGAWTTALLGVCASEVHLCGEETAVPLVQERLRDTGDELIVNRYERLTPLKVADAPLGEDFKGLEPGDCIVTFSQNQLWDLKQDIEKTTGYRCAVVYGRLPPETRNEQALLFNDPDSGYDILIGSDAIGMGLNL